MNARQSDNVLMIFFALALIAVLVLINYQLRLNHDLQQKLQNCQNEK